MGKTKKRGNQDKDHRDVTPASNPTAPASFPCHSERSEESVPLDVLSLANTSVPADQSLLLSVPRPDVLTSLREVTQLAIDNSELESLAVTPTIIAKTRTQATHRPGAGTSTKKRPTLSLCMIVKNEEKFLPDCLESTKNLVDEMVIVDTGSTDRTIEIAESYGAKVYRFEWVNDFAAARNESLAHATGDWILYLDADERIDEENGKKLRELIANPGVNGAFFIRILNKMGSGDSVRWSMHSYPRVFVNRPRIRFEGAIHEQIQWSLTRAKISIDVTDVTITHLGYYDSSKDMEQVKAERNLPILLKEATDFPDSFFAHFNLGRCYVGLGRYQEALEELDLAIGCNQANYNNGVRANARIVKGMLLRSKGELDAAVSSLQEALRIDDSAVSAASQIAEIRFEQGRYEEASDWLEKALKTRERRIGSTFLVDSAENNEATMLVQLGQVQALLCNYNEAQSAMEQALQTDPALRMPVLLLAEIKRLNGDISGALQRYREYALMVDDGEYGKALALYNWGIACARLGDIPAAETPLLQSARLDPDNVVTAQALAGALLDQGKNQEAVVRLQQIASTASDILPILRLLAKVCAQIQDHRALLATYSDMLHAGEDPALVMVGFGNVYMALGHEDRALECYQKAIEANPNYAPAWRAISAHCARTGELAMARECEAMALSVG